MGHGKTKEEVIDVKRTIKKRGKGDRVKTLKSVNLMVRSDSMDLYKDIQNCVYVLLIHYHFVGLMRCCRPGEP